MKKILILSVLAFIGCEQAMLTPENVSKTPKSRYEASLYCFSLDNNSSRFYTEDPICQALIDFERAICQALANVGFEADCNDTTFVATQPIRLNAWMKMAGHQSFSEKRLNQLIKEAKENG